MVWVNYRDIDSVIKIRESQSIQVYCMNTAKYIILKGDNNNFINEELDIELPRNWVVKENKYLIQDPYLKDCLYVIDRIYFNE